MTRFVKLAAAAIGAAGAVAGATLLHPRTRARRGTQRIELTGVAVAPRRRRGSTAITVDGVRAALAASFGADAAELTIRVQHGIVTLRGEVDHIDDIGLYETAVREVPGVVDVDNLLRLRLMGSRPRVLSA